MKFRSLSIVDEDDLLENEKIDQDSDDDIDSYDSDDPTSYDFLFSN